jgi:hypothetical protein
MNFDEWWEREGRFHTSDVRKFAAQVWELATTIERNRCAGIARSLGGHVDLDKPDEAKLCANSIEWDIRGRPQNLDVPADEAQL